MIAATIKADELVRRLNARAALIGQRHGELIGKTHQPAGTNWRSASSLWPDLGLD